MEPETQEARKSSTATGLTAAGVRAFGTRAVAFYFRTPVKAFFKSRVDYLAFARAINPRAQDSWSLRLTTPGLLLYAIKTQGWGFVPKYVLPPLFANISIGAILYTTYLQTLGILHAHAAKDPKRVFPPSPPNATFAAGALAGICQSIIAAPVDALSMRFKATELLDGRYKSMWQYCFQKLREIGPRGVSAGWGLNCLKDSFGYAVFFSTFEYVKAQCYYKFITMYYGGLKGDVLSLILKPKVVVADRVDVIKPHYSIEPTFLLAAGVTASIAQQIITHPISKVQQVHVSVLARPTRQAHVQQVKRYESKINFIKAYRRTFDICHARVIRAGGWRRWAYKRFWMSSIKQVPSTSAGLIIFELIRRRYGSSDEVKIEMEGYDILLS